VLQETSATFLLNHTSYSEIWIPMNHLFLRMMHKPKGAQQNFLILREALWPCFWKGKKQLVLWTNVIYCHWDT